MLREQKNARLAFFSSGAVTEPCCQWHTRCIFRCDAAHIQHDCTEAAGLQQQDCRLRRLLKTRPGLSGDNWLFTRSQLPRRIGFEDLSLGFYSALWLRTSGRRHLRSQKTTDCIRESFDLIARMPTEPATVQTFLDRRRDEIFFWKRKAICSD